MNCCKTCKYWNTYGSYLGECMKLLHCYMIELKTEMTVEYGKYGEFDVEHPVEKINTNELFYCNQYESGEWKGF